MPAKFEIKASTYIYAVLLLLAIPLQWLFAWILAATVHEFCHWFAVRLCGGEVYSVTVGIGGAEMKCSPMTGTKRLIAVLCGPIGGAIPVLFARWIPQTALCCCFLSAYNLLPLLHLDGGKIAAILFGKKAVFVELVFLIILSIGAVFLSLGMDFGIMPIAISVILWLRSRNNPCKANVCKVQ